MKYIITIYVTFFLALFSNHALSINKCFDEHGRITYQAKPCPGSDRKNIVRTSPEKTARVPEEKKITPESFFEKYVQLSDNFDPAVSKLYSNKARIHSQRIYPFGVKKRNAELSGSQWKKIVEKAMPIAKAKNDRSSFTNINISKQNNTFKIKADRYSLAKCYKDLGYYMIIKKADSNSFVIVEEYMETKALSDC